MIQRLRQIALVHWLLTSAAAAAAPESVVGKGPVEVTVSVGSQQAFVAQPIELRIQVDAPAAATVRLPELAETLGPFEIRDVQITRDIPVAGRDDIRRWMARAQIESLKTGELTIPPLEVQVQLNHGASAAIKLRSDPLGVRIVSLLQDGNSEATMRDLKDVIDVPVPRDRGGRWRWWIGGALVALVGAASAAIYLVGRRAKLSAERWARRQIQEVEQAFAAQQADPAGSFERLAGIMGEYLQLRFPPQDFGTPQSDASDSRSRVLSHLPPDTRRQVNDLLKVAEQVKFARLTMSPDDAQRAIGQVRQLIEQCERSAQSAVDSEK